MGTTCSTYETLQICIQSFSRKIWVEVVDKAKSVRISLSNIVIHHQHYLEFNNITTLPMFTLHCRWIHTLTALYWLRINSQTMSCYYKIIIFHPFYKLLKSMSIAWKRLGICKLKGIRKKWKRECPIYSDRTGSILFYCVQQRKNGDWNI